MSATATKEISDWLEKLGMSEYAQRFAKNGINVAALPHLTDQDLKEIGVLLDCSRPSASWRVQPQHQSPRPQLSQSRKTPPSAAKSR